MGVYTRSSTILYDRIFWIYFIITLFFVIIGATLLLSSITSYIIIITILWILSNVGLMILVYNVSVNCSPRDPTDENNLVCVLDSGAAFLDAQNRIWLLINILFIILLVVGVLWAGELRNNDAGYLRNVSGILMLLGGLILSKMIWDLHYFSVPFWISIGFIIIWLGLTIYTITGIST